MAKKSAKDELLYCMLCTTEIKGDCDFIFAQCHHRNHYWHTECEQSLSCCVSYCTIHIKVELDCDSSIYMPNAYSSIIEFSRDSFNQNIIVASEKDKPLVRSLFLRALTWIKGCPEWGITDARDSYYNVDLIHSHRISLPYDYKITSACVQYLRESARTIFHFMVISMHPLQHFYTTDSVSITGSHPIAVRDMIFQYIDTNVISNHNFDTMLLKQK